MTANQTKAVAAVQKNLADAKLSVTELQKKMETLKEERGKQEAALAAAEGVLKTKMDDSDIIRKGAEKSFNTTKATLMDSYKDSVSEHKKSLDKKLELFSEEKQLVELVRGAVWGGEEKGGGGESVCVCVCVVRRGGGRLGQRKSGTAAGASAAAAGRQGAGCDGRVRCDGSLDRATKARADGVPRSCVATPGGC
jgi:hypothetical protein